MNRTQPRIAVLMDVAVSSFLEKAFSGILKYLKEADVSAVFFGLGISSPGDEAYGTQLAFLDMINSDEFDGILCISTVLENKDAVNIKQKLREFTGLPMVSIGPSLMGEDNLIFDNREGIRMIMEHLINIHGYKRYAYISGPAANQEAQLRFDTFNKELKKAGITFDESMFFESNFVTSGGYESTEKLLDTMDEIPEVIVCANDRMALGAYNALRNRGYNVPNDIAVTGFDGEELDGTISHQLTTVRQSFEEIGYRAAKAIHRKINREVPETEYVHATLRINSSCGCVEFHQRCNIQTRGKLPEELLNFKEHLDRYLQKKCPDTEKNNILAEWQEIIFTALSRKIPVFHLEQLLIECGRDARPLKLRSSAFLQLMYSIVKDLTGHSYYTNVYKQQGEFSKIRGTIDSLHNDLITTCSLRSHDETLQRLMSQCGTDNFHLLVFVDFDTIGKGAIPVFSDAAKSGRMKKKVHSRGNWFPDGDGIFVSNIISYENQRYAYYMMDADIHNASLFEYFRLRFSAIAQDLRNHIELRRLNKDLMREIKAKKQTEHMLKEEISMRRNAESELKEALSKVHQLSIQDELTGLHNRRGFLTLVEQQMRYLQRNNTGFYILYIDMDGLKTINDKWGHNDGDAALCAAGEILQNVLRESDIVARIGGDEFAAMVNAVSESGIKTIRTRIDEECRKKTAELNNGWILSLSIGYQYAGPAEEHGIEELLNLADEKLYKEKTKRKETGEHPYSVDMK